MPEESMKPLQRFLLGFKEFKVGWQFLKQQRKYQHRHGTRHSRADHLILIRARYKSGLGHTAN